MGRTRSSIGRGATALVLLAGLVLGGRYLVTLGEREDAHLREQGEALVSACRQYRALSRRTGERGLVDNSALYCESVTESITATCSASTQLFIQTHEHPDREELLGRAARSRTHQVLQGPARIGEHRQADTLGDCLRELEAFDSAIEDECSSNDRFEVCCRAIRPPLSSCWRFSDRCSELERIVGEDGQNCPYTEGADPS